MLVLIGIVLTFALPKFSNLTYQSNITKLKSQYTMIQNGIREYKTKKILLNENDELDSLDNALVNTNKNHLFSKILKQTSILSTTNTIKEHGSWVKSSNSSYSFIVSNDKTINFKLEDSVFKCVSDEIVCKEVY